MDACIDMYVLACVSDDAMPAAVSAAPAAPAAPAVESIEGQVSKVNAWLVGSIECNAMMRACRIREGLLVPVGCIDASSSNATRNGPASQQTQTAQSKPTPCRLHRSHQSRVARLGCALVSIYAAQTASLLPNRPSSLTRFRSLLGRILARALARSAAADVAPQHAWISIDTHISRIASYPIKHLAVQSKGGSGRVWLCGCRCCRGGFRASSATAISSPSSDTGVSAAVSSQDVCIATLTSSIDRSIDRHGHTYTHSTAH